MALKILPVLVADADEPGLLADPDEGLLGWHSLAAADVEGSGVLGGRWILVPADGTEPSLRAGGAVLRALPFLYNGAPAWAKTASDGGPALCCFKSVSEGWILLEAAADPREPVCELSLDGETHEGDAWWRCAEPSVAAPRQDSLDPQGALLDEDPAPDSPVLEWFWPRWRRDPSEPLRTAPAGVYEGVDGAEAVAAVRTVGSLVLKDGDDCEWVEAPDGESFRCAARGLSLREEDGAGWVAGDWPHGLWWRASGRPSRTGEITLTPQRGDEAPEGPDGRTALALAPQGFRIVPGRATCRIAEVALWR